VTARWLAVALVYLAGVAAAGLLGQIAPVAGQVRTDLTLSLANGLVAQFGSVGALVGPPLFGVAVSAAGWPALVPVIAGLTVAGATLLLVADARRPARLGDGGRRDSRPLG
jgi:MFS family permease